MYQMGLNEIREQFLNFFESKGHLRMESASLIPQNDPSLLLINSGMAQFKAYFTGQETPPSKRITTCQKCIRTPDIDRVGKTARHGTFFEMLGNFSFGDYFKSEAISWAWEFVTEVVKIPTDRLWVSVYQDDNETEQLWIEQIGVPKERIVRLGKEDNFWEHGTGPCGPCSEIYYDMGEEFGCTSTDCTVGCDCDRYVEFWNLVFTQFNKDDKGNYTPLANPNIDTGMGIERLATIVQGVDSIFEVDTVASIMHRIAKLAGVAYKSDEKTDIALRVITDHIRSTVFMVGDGVAPSNEGRGYVLRRLIRRAALHGKKLSIKDTFLHDVANVVIEQNASAYPELTEKQAYITKIIKLEEERFSQTIEQGMQVLDDFIIKTQGNILSGEQAFKLYDTYGFPIDLTTEILAERNFKVHLESFHNFMQEQRERARNARNNASSWDNNSQTYETDEQTTSPAFARAHSATHLLQAALRKELGEHVVQKGSFVGEDRLRFDFSHFEPLTKDILDKVEKTVNENIMHAIKVDISNMPINQAKEMGAMALFSEKYGDVVRVVQIGDASIELCSGHHVENSGNIGLFKINSESGVAAGVRRIDASVGFGVIDIINSQAEQIAQDAEKFRDEIKKLNREIKQLKSSNFSGASNAKTQVIDGVTVSSLKLDSSDIEILRSSADELKSKANCSVVAVGGADSEGVRFVVSATPSAVEKGVHSGDIVREISAIAGGRGGGKPNFAQAGGTDATKVDQALEAIFSIKIN